MNPHGYKQGDMLRLVSYATNKIYGKFIQVTISMDSGVWGRTQEGYETFFLNKEVEAADIKRQKMMFSEEDLWV